MFSFLLSLFEKFEANNIRLTVNQKIDIMLSLLNIDITDKNLFLYSITSNAANNQFDREKVLNILQELNRRKPNINVDIQDMADRFTKDLRSRKASIETSLKNIDILRLLIYNQNHKTPIENYEILNKLYDALTYEENESDFVEFITKISQDNKELIDKLFANSPTKEINQTGKEIKSTKDIRHIEFSKISDENIKQLQQSIKIAARRLIRKIFNSNEIGNSHILNVHKTLRKNTAFENIPFMIEFKKKRRKKRDIVILCDMSQSVRHSAFIMLAFMNEVSLIFKRVRSFAFISDVTEITRIMMNNDFNYVASSLLSGGINNIFGNSNYGLSFYKFYTKYKNILNRNTIVIIIGDGRNNYNEPNLFDLKNIKKKVNRLYWFVPEKRELWGKGDSQLPLYLTVSDRAFTTTTLSQLSTAILKIAQ